MKQIAFGLIGVSLAVSMPIPFEAAHAHHSFAVFFNSTKLIKIKGTVTAFSFTNPHGIIALKASSGSGPIQQWRVETNAPVILMRRGWARDSVKPGDVVTIEGWPSHDGKPYMRLRQAIRSNGAPIGTPFGQSDS